MLINYLKTAWRNIITQKLHSLINIGGLSVAMTAVVLIMMWVQNELRFDIFQPDASRIFLVKTYERADKNNVSITENSPYPLSAALKEFPEVEIATNAQRTQRNELTLRVHNKLFSEEWGLYVDKNFFKVFRYEFIEGNAQNFFAFPHSLLITESKAKMLFGKSDVVGSLVQIDSINYTVQAVIKNNPVNSSFQFEVLMPMEAILNSTALVELNFWSNLGHKTFVKLKPGADTAKSAARVTALFKKNLQNNNFQASMLPLTGIHFDNDFQFSAFNHGSLKTVKIFSVLATLLLLSVSINYVNLSVARAGTRLKEISVRKIVGAGRLQLFFQMVTESILTSLLALIVTTLLVSLLLPFFNWFTGIKFLFDPFEPGQALVLFGTTLALILLTGIYPALLLSSINPINLFRGLGVFQLKDTSFKKVLVITQFAMSAIITIAAIVVYKQLQFIQHQDNRYNRSQVFTIKIPTRELLKINRNQWTAFLQPVKNDLLAQKEVQFVSAMNLESVVNYTFQTGGNLDWDGKKPDYNPDYVDFSADADFNKIMKFKFLEGRWFEGNNFLDNKNTILNETAVKQFGLKEPVVGRRFKDGIVIGVVKDFYYKSMHEKIAPVVIKTDPHWYASFMVQTYPGMTAEALHAVRDSWHKYFPDDTFIYNFLDEEFDKLYRDDQRALSFTLAFSGISILISCIGLLGMMVFATGQRRKEIGIRKVMGASVANIVTLLSTNFLKLISISILIAFPIAWWAINKWLEDFAYRVYIGWQTFAIAGFLILAIAIFTISLQAIKAAISNPVKSLKTE